MISERGAVAQCLSLRDRLSGFVGASPVDEELVRLVERLRDAGDDVPQWSLLAPHGEPIEAVYRRSEGEAGAGFSFTVESAGATPAARWARVRQIFGAEVWTPAGASRDFLRELLGQEDQLYGSWIGLRVASGRVVSKLYHEVCDGPMRVATLARLERILGTAGSPLVPELVGFTEEGAEEFYCEVKGARPSLVHALLRAAGVADRELMLRAALTRLSGLEYGEFLRTMKMWMSFKIRPGQAVMVSVILDLHGLVQVDSDASRLLDRYFVAGRGELALPRGADGWSYTMCSLTLQDGGVDTAVGFGLP